MLLIGEQRVTRLHGNSSAPSRDESVYIRFLGQEEIEEAAALVLAGFAYAQQDQIFSKTFERAGSANHVPEPHEGFYCVFRVVVVPWNAVVIEECKQPIPRLLDTALISGGNLRLELATEHFIVKPFDLSPMFAKVPGFQAKPVHGFNDCSQQIGESAREQFHFFVERVFAEIL